ncbi:DNA primase [Corynebacterium minutissimum]|uniref:DNA primase n=1 Tax=Corynebacterium minutissimum TaxID=38301 RepID=A0A2X4RB55_9CORY|nr:DNA primase [Corynebacterium minutissimum]KHO28794.1 DNA primase [Corynebacterium minutissimum]QPS59423.1 DNA primase [Corynebacterium minutissimum]QQA79787.1 DNA primase [Corynebacterium minutissimum]SQH99113.1 DNA primase [Corynebacterium minutissimum]VEG06564.1 DNA primase [Corynebacterium minutissimum]
MARGRIPDSDIQAIRERAPIEEIVGEYVQLKPAGYDSLKGLSPFKDEKTPSFHVRPQRGYYHCFSTGKGGDVFSFLMEMEQVTFPEAVEAVAQRIGYHINYQGGSTGARDEKPGTRQRLIAANKAAHEFYRQQLETPQAATGREFLLDRGFSKDIIYDFECGYAPEGWDTATKHLLRMGFSFEELEAAGISKMGKRGPIDRFHRRLLWPIKDLSGNVIGFGARKLFDDDKLGKYMNTPETMLYRKSKVLFGLDLAKRNIAEQHQAVVVEGYTDVMAMYAAGVKTAVASCGTAFGGDHLQVLRRLMLDDSYFHGELIYTFDGDEAGQKAAMRAFEGEQKFTGQSFVSVAPDGMDPCDLRLERGDAAVRDLVADRIPMFEFVIRSVISDFSIDSAEGRLQALRRAVPVVAQIRDQPLQREYARRLAGWVGWPDPEEVLHQVRQEARKPKKQERPRFASLEETSSAPAQSAAPVMHIPGPREPHLWPQREALKLALQYPQIAGSYFDGITEDAYSNEAYRTVRQAISTLGGVTAGAEQPGVEWLAAVAGEMPDLMARNFVSELAVEPIKLGETGNPNTDLEAYADSVLSRLQEARVGDQVAQLKAQLGRMRPSDDEESYNSLFADLVALEQARRELNDRAFRGVR